MDFQEDFPHNQSERVTSVFLRIIHDDNPRRGMDLFSSGDIFEFMKGFGKFFYVISPSETSVKDTKDVPSYFTDVSMNIL